MAIKNQFDNKDKEPCKPLKTRVELPKYPACLKRIHFNLIFEYVMLQDDTNKRCDTDFQSDVQNSQNTQNKSKCPH